MCKCRFSGAGQSDEEQSDRLLPEASGALVGGDIAAMPMRFIGGRLACLVRNHPSADGYVGQPVYKNETPRRSILLIVIEAQCLFGLDFDTANLIEF